jgi:hypothetical protein
MILGNKIDPGRAKIFLDDNGPQRMDISMTTEI